ncbi:MAG: PDZ domain-containing protein [Gammaproteobacteria bacterium]|nr:PDZ domain-containing protein [Gammaproteobacteria bacterium]
MNVSILHLILLAALLSWTPLVAADEPAPDNQAEIQAMLEEAERARSEAEAVRREAEKLSEMASKLARQEAEMARQEAEMAREEAEMARQEAAMESEEAEQRRAAAEQRERERALQREDMVRAREELSRAHRELREATREVARAHRELAMTDRVHKTVRVVNLGDRAVIGLVLGRSTEDGVEVVGVSPDGPAERAGIQQGDIIVSLRGEALGGDGRDRRSVHRIMAEVEDGEELAVSVLRDGESWDFTVVAARREPSSWQTMIRLPEVAEIEGLHGEPHIVTETIRIPEIDEAAMAEHVEKLQKELKTHKFAYAMPGGGEFEFEGDFDIEVAEYSELADHAMREANIWFGLPQAQGLDLAEINEGLGAYFKTDRGVLVIRAREDNAYGLESGDVILEVGETTVDSPADMMRALRELEPGSELELKIKRDRKNRTLTAVMPENRLGLR